MWRNLALFSFLRLYWMLCSKVGGHWTTFWWSDSPSMKLIPWFYMRHCNFFFFKSEWAIAICPLFLSHISLPQSYMASLKWKKKKKKQTTKTKTKKNPKPLAFYSPYLELLLNIFKILSTHIAFSCHGLLSLLQLWQFLSHSLSFMTEE